MDLLSGLEQFGINVEQENTEIYAEEKHKEQNKVKTSDEKTVVRAKRPETEFLFTKRIRCTICDRVFDVRMVKNARVKRLQPDFDLRPRFENIDTLKYDVYACPYCG